MGLERGRCTEVEHRDEQREKLGEEESDFIQSSCNNAYLVTNTTSTVVVCGMATACYHFSPQAKQFN